MLKRTKKLEKEEFFYNQKIEEKLNNYKKKLTKSLQKRKAVERKWEMKIYSGYTTTDGLTTKNTTNTNTTNNSENGSDTDTKDSNTEPGPDTSKKKKDTEEITEPPSGSSLLDNNKSSKEKKKIGVDIYRKEVVCHGFLFISNAKNSLKIKTWNLKESLMILFE